VLDRFLHGVKLVQFTGSERHEQRASLGATLREPSVEPCAGALAQLRGRFLHPARRRGGTIRRPFGIQLFQREPAQLVRPRVRSLDEQSRQLGLDSSAQALGDPSLVREKLPDAPLE
jgi:hypothetical protein